ncbi:zinc ribbon domain-containing protein [Streptomyces sp. XM4193]|uniref:zinc ribbon domain-containing protein n=1 Tax=Streptomyces sp. XM4193 TaxID=2929782 RepID=UPI001FF9ADB6|nr:zinc ribbon domain-containing protein [Streptomyces sp. XM4193]MCK1795905.1 zinc ribbon domain-containing protein [Streptomyces sp. XM4193]
MSRVRVAGVRTAWTTVEDGEFFCPACGGDRNYELRTGRRRLTVLRVPLLPRGTTGPTVVCSSCEGHFEPSALQQPTTTQLGSLLRDAVHAVALSVLGAGGAGSRTARDAAVGWLRNSGFASCDEEQLLTLLAALDADRAEPEHITERRAAPYATGLTSERELRAVLAPLAPHLESGGREGLLLEGACIALADGPYEDAELAVLAVVGDALRIPAEDVDRLLAAAPERS